MRFPNDVVSISEGPKSSVVACLVGGEVVVCEGL